MKSSVNEMEKHQQKLHSHHHSEERTKILRNESNQTIMLIENLSDEIFYEIFDYLDGYHVHRTFSQLNSRFHSLFTSPYFLLKLTIRGSTAKETFLKTYKEMILSNKNQILSIHFLSSTHHQLIPLLNIDSSFTRLQSLILNCINATILIPFLSKMIHLPRLFSLTIDTQGTLNDLNEIYQLVFHLPILKYIKFYMINSNGSNLTISLPMNLNQQLNHIEYLIVDHPCTFTELFLIMSYTSEINRLNFIHQADYTFQIDMISPMILGNLTYLSIDGDRLRFNEFQMFIRKIHSNLKVLSLTHLTEDITYLNGNSWKEFIQKYLPRLEKLHFTFSICFMSNHTTPMYTGQLNTFHSPFWIERQWLLQAEIQIDTIIYSIHSYKYEERRKMNCFPLLRKRSYEENLTSELSKSMRLITTIIPYGYPNASLKELISHISSVANIYHLEINEEISMDMLMEIVLLLPELDSLQMSSLLYSNAIYMTDKDNNVFSLLKSQNQIRKVYLKKMTNIEEILFLIGLCPRMTYLKVAFGHPMNILLCTRLILIEINVQCNHPLRLLSFHVRAADDQIIEQLNNMIQLQRLLIDYTIKRILDDIYLQWK